MADIIPVFAAYCQEYHTPELVELLLAGQPERSCAFELDMMLIVNNLTTLAQNLLQDPFNVLPALDEGLRRALALVMRGHVLVESMTWKPAAHVRINLGTMKDIVRHLLPRAGDVGRLTALRGTIIRVATAKMREIEREYQCVKCKHIFCVTASFELFCTIAVPTTCPSDADGAPCNGTKFKETGVATDAPSDCKDYQEIKLQEQISSLAVGNIPRAITVIVEEDMVDACKPGDDVTVSGIVRRRWKPFKASERCEAEIVLHANHVQVNNEQRSKIRVTGCEELREEFAAFWTVHSHHALRGRNSLLAAVCPQVFGLYIVKLSVALILIGGVARVDKSGTRVRGESHLLLVGDPGTGKSQFLKYAAKLVPRSVMTTGIGSTSAGLTVTAVKEGPEWVLEAGALVLADGGLCCIDEFNSIRETDRGSIHEAMEQQTLSVAKAGLVCKLNTRTTIIAACNPKGQYDPDQILSVNVAVASPLLSRFDLVIVLLDTRNPEWDTIVSSFILGLHDHPLLLDDASAAPLWTLDKLQAYISYVKGIDPTMTPECETVLSKYYQLQRQSDGHSQARTTVRLLESMARLAQAHARLMCRVKVTLQDAICAIIVMECTLQATGLFPESHALHSSFPVDPDGEFDKYREIVLVRLGLECYLGIQSIPPGLPSGARRPSSQPARPVQQPVDHCDDDSPSPPPAPGGQRPTPPRVAPRAVPPPASASRLTQPSGVLPHPAWAATSAPRAGEASQHRRMLPHLSPTAPASQQQRPARIIDPPAAAQLLPINSLFTLPPLPPRAAPSSPTTRIFGGIIAPPTPIIAEIDDLPLLADNGNTTTSGLHAAGHPWPGLAAASALPAGCALPLTPRDPPSVACAGMVADDDDDWFGAELASLRQKFATSNSGSQA